MDNGDRKRATLSTLLSGLNLEEEEMCRFENENIGLENFSSLTEDDLIVLGINDSGKRKDIMKVVYNLRLRRVKEQPNLKKLESLSWKDGLTVVENSNRHMKLLHGVVQFMASQQRNRKRKLSSFDGFLDKDWTCSTALLASASIAVSQLHSVCLELEQLKDKIDANHDSSIVNNKVRRKNKIVILTTLFMASIGIVGFVLWRTNSSLIPK